MGCVDIGRNEVRFHNKFHSKLHDKLHGKLLESDL